MPEDRVFRPHERPDVEVLVNAVWCAGELRMWQWRDDEGGWWGQVQYRPQGEHSSRIETVPADRIREDASPSDPHGALRGAEEAAPPVGGNGL